MYEGCPESIRPFLIFQEPVAWPWCNFAAGQRKPYCESVNTHCPVGLVSRQWDALDWACVLCDSRFHNDRARRSASSRQCACPFYSSHAGFCFGKASQHPGLSAPYSPDLASCDFWLFPKIKSQLKGRRFVNATVTQYTSSVNGVSLSTYEPHGRVIFHLCTVRSPLTGCQVTSRPRDRLSRYSKWLDTFRTTLVGLLFFCE